MAMKIFLLLNGVGVLFLVYVSIQFWKEEHRTKYEVARCRAIEVPYQDRTKVVLVTRPISHGVQLGRSVIPIQGLGRGLKGGQVHRDSDMGTLDVPLTRLVSKTRGAR